MRLLWRSICMCTALAVGLTPVAAAETPMTWADVRARFEANNPTLQAGKIGIDESRAQEVSAFLRPNPQCAIALDQVGHTVAEDSSTNPFSAATLSGNCGYLHEREHKRELRRDSAADATTVARSMLVDVERNLVFELRSAFVQMLQAKALRALARDNLSAYDRVLAASRDRFQAGDIAQMDLDRLELQRVSYESDVQTAEVNLRTAGIQLLRLLDDQKTPVESFDVVGPFDVAARTPPLDDVRRTALDTRPDLRAAAQAADKAKVDQRLAMANGSADPTLSVDAGVPSISQAWQGYQPPLRQYVGVSVDLPLRIFDRNQGEKARTALEISRSERLVDAARSQVLADVDTAYATVISTAALLQPYKDRYLAQAARVRDTVSFSYQGGGASLLDFLQAQQEYRTVQIGFVSLVGAYLNAVSQLNFAVGMEVIP
jgi:cobalt-zinc-cadmium efflux system outer membrane protein